MFNPIKIRRSAGQKVNARRFRARAARRATELAEALGFADSDQHAGVTRWAVGHTVAHPSDKAAHLTSRPLRPDGIARSIHTSRARSEEAGLILSAVETGLRGVNALAFVDREIQRAKEADRVRRAPVIPCYTRQNRVVLACDSERGAQLRDRKAARANCRRSHEAYANGELHTLISAESARQHRALLSACYARPVSTREYREEPSQEALEQARARRTAFEASQVPRDAARAALRRQEARNAAILRSLGFDPDMTGRIVFQPSRSNLSPAPWAVARCNARVSGCGLPATPESAPAITPIA